MSREIRFRAWDGKKMIHPAAVRGDTGAWFAQPMDYVNAISHHGPLMQFTGLTDRNGVEIYEGDIVEHGHISHGKVQSEVRFHSGGFFHFPNWTGMNWGELNRIQHSCEVIGNICEHPHLLEGE